MDLATLKQALIEGDDQQVAVLTRRALDEGLPAESILNDALIAGMGEVGELFEQGEYFVPELLLSARAMQAAMEVLRPLLTASNYQPLGKVVMGTVQGDLHDIGKKLVAMMLEGSGFEVIDVGTDIPPGRFVEVVEETGAQIVGLSALLTTTLPAMEATVSALREAGPVRVKVMVGGAPVTSVFAQSIGADGYAPDASSAVALARRLVGIPTVS
ncbi:MAG: corrinoid protein [Chloroflexota bacterium]|nr:corrinoid protein [Chloroflexota bacterium]